MKWSEESIYYDGPRFHGLVNQASV